jgi:hypothetical protein
MEEVKKNEQEPVDKVDAQVPEEFAPEVERITAKYDSYNKIVTTDGSIKFDFFMDVFSTVCKWADHGFKGKRAELITRRRKHFEKQDDPKSKEKYYKTCMLIAISEEDYFCKYLSSVLGKLGIDEKDFKDQIQVFSADPETSQDLQKVKQNVMEGNYTL